MYRVRGRVDVFVYCVQGSDAAYLGMDSNSNLLDPSLLIT